MGLRLHGAGLLLCFVRCNGLLRMQRSAVDVDNSTCTGPLRHELRNDGDASFMLSLNVGGQRMDVIPDTGSYELVVFARSCDGCGDKDLLYQEAKTGAFHLGLLEAKQSYGSGSTQSREAYDTVGLGCLEVANQVFWEVYEASMPIIEQGSFQGIFGLGPPADNPVMARQELAHVKEELSQMQMDGFDTSAYDSVVANLEDIAKFSIDASLWLTNLNIRSYSICFRPSLGSPGVFVFNDDAVERYPNSWVSVPVIGDKYWSTTISSVRLGDDGEILDCGGQGCSAIFDTGTSLIAAPPEVVEKVVSLMRQYSDISDHCKDLSRLPELTFEFNGHKFSLPPDSYVGEIESDDIEWIRKILPHLAEQMMLRENRSIFKSEEDDSENDDEQVWCCPLLMSLDQDPNAPREWILGIPFFRHYYTNFQLGEDAKEGSSIQFTRPDENCNVGGQDNSENGVQEPTSFGRRPLRVAASKLRAPRHRHKKKAF